MTTVEKQDEHSVTTTTTKPTIKTISEQKNEPSIITIDTTTEATKKKNGYVATEGCNTTNG